MNEFYYEAHPTLRPGRASCTQCGEYLEDCVCQPCPDSPDGEHRSHGGSECYYCGKREAECDLR